MDHQEIINAKLLDRYLLGEMTEPERDVFEEHYFSCGVCAEELVTAVKFVDNARRPLLRLEAEDAAKETEARGATGGPPAALESEKHPGRRPQSWWDRWLSLAPKPALAGACGCLAVALFWQSMPAGVNPEVTGSYFVTATREGSQAPRRILVKPGQDRVALLFNHTDTTVTRFDFKLEDAEGSAVQRFAGDAPRDTNDIQVMVPVRSLRTGMYTLRIKNAATHADVAALPFELATP